MLANALKANLPLHTLDLSTQVKNEIVTAEQIDSINEIFSACIQVAEKQLLSVLSPKS